MFLLAIWGVDNSEFVGKLGIDKEEAKQGVCTDISWPKEAVLQGAIDKEPKTWRVDNSDSIGERKVEERDGRCLNEQKIQNTLWNVQQQTH